MGSKLSMTSVNKIKELAEAKEYSLALEIIDSQDLTKSLNPQFLRLCGDVYAKCGRYKDARYTYLLAHKLSPEAKRVVFSLMKLYLDIGYKKLAETYYNMYMFDASNTDLETRVVRYVYEKSKGMDYTIIDDYIVDDYEHTLDEEWSYEAILLLYLNDQLERAKALSTEYIASFKNSPNVVIVQDLLDGKIKARDCFFVFPEEIEDDDPEQEEERNLEKELLAADDLRMHPKEPEILYMEDDFDVPFEKKSKFFEKKDKKKNKE